MSPVIGLTCDYDLRRNLREAILLNPDYVEMVEQAGAVPLLVPPIRSTAAMRRVLERVDGVVLTGGDDYNPRLWGEEPHESWVPIMPRREEFDLAFASALLNTGVPVLGICGGMQLINISLGGTLIQDIPSEFPDARPYSKTAPDVAVNEVAIDPGTMLAPDAGGPRSVQVRCYHHQAIRQVAPGLKVTGRSVPDGITMVIEGDTPGRFLLGVQWHPEKHLPSVGPDTEFALEVMHTLVNAAMEYREKSGRRISASG